MKQFLLFLFLVSSSILSAQGQKKIDSLERLQFNEMPDTQRVKVYTNLANLYRFIDADKQKEYATKAIGMGRGLSAPAILADAYNQMGLVLENEGRYDVAIQYYDSSKIMWSKEGSVSGEAKMDLNIANVYIKKADQEKATDFVLKSQQLQQSINDTFGVAVCKFTLGNIYFGQGNSKKALRQYLDAWQLNRTSANNFEFESVVLSNIGGAFLELNQHDSALYYYRIARNNFVSRGFESRLTSNSIELGAAWRLKGNLDSALYYHRLALQQVQRMKAQDEVAKICMAFGDDFNQAGQSDSAIYYYTNALEQSKRIGLRETLLTAYLKLSQVFAAKKDFEKALDYSNSYHTLYDSLHGEEQASAIERIKTGYVLEQKDKELQLAETAKLAADERNNRNLILFISAGVLALLVIGVVLFMFRTKQKHNHILTKKNEEISIQQEEIKASINYAKRIQEAILPDVLEIQKAVSSCFVLWKPRDIVSGDFYWFAERGSLVFLAAADCTGHGVPGAFMSMIGNTLLNEIVLEKEIDDPGKILDMLHVRVQQALKQNAIEQGRGGSAQDGMDISLVVLNNQKQQICVAGANRPVYLIRENGNQLEEISADKRAIGGSEMGIRKPFQTKEILLNRGDSVYLFTDGYVDQFGGPSEKKLLSKRFQEILLKHSTQPMEIQKQELDATFNSWKGNLDQVDDVLVIGARF
jgi:serine phosphatase RsbU (regulator of sigma subunit)